MTEQTNGPLTIIELISENIKCLKAVRIRPDGSLIQITGPNEAGKSAVLDSITMALGGKGKIPPQPVRRGAATARIVLDLGEIKVERRWTPKGHTYLDVTGPSGEKFSEPQAVLDEFHGELTIDPLAFSRMKPTEQADTLRAAIGLDLSEIDIKKSAAYAKRTLVNHKVRDIEGLIAQVPAGIEAVPDEESDVTALVTALQKMHGILHDNQAKRDVVTDATKELDRRKDALRLAIQAVAQAQVDEREVASMKERHAEEIHELSMRTDAGTGAWGQKVLSTAQEKRDAEAILKSTGDRLETVKAEAEATTDPDVAGKQAEIEQADQTNTMVRAKKLWIERRGERDRLAGESEQLTSDIAQLDADRQSMIAEAPMPVPGVSFDDAGMVTFDGLPFEQASQAVKIKVSTAIALAANPRFKVIRIKDGSLLDEASMAQMAKLADEAGGQLWIERVAKRGERVGFTIEDGELVEDATVAGATQ